ncbi:MAG: helical backbone metal receptor [Oscillospiraceae bacterium]|nr:helical backbone metal receptor [Oscillospiraceae bacterium]
MKKLIAILLVVFLIVLTAGCDDNNDTEETNEPELTEEPVDEPEPYPLIIGGVEITASPNRVVSLSPSLSEIIYEIGYGNRIIGRGIYCDYPPAIQQTPDAGSSANPDIDKMIALSPSLVITAAPLSQMDMFRMEQDGIQTLVIPPASDLSGLRDVYRALGLVFEGIFTGTEKGEEAFSALSKACDNTGVVNIGKFVYITKDLKAATGDTLESAIFSCFGENIAENGADYTFDLSLLAENQPDIILLNDRYTVNNLLDSDAFNELDAVLNNRIILIDNTYFERPSVRLVHMMMNMIAEYRIL